MAGAPEAPVSTTQIEGIIDPTAELHVDPNLIQGAELTAVYRRRLGLWTKITKSRPFTGPYPWYEVYINPDNPYTDTVQRNNDGGPIDEYTGDEINQLPGFRWEPHA